MHCVIVGCGRLGTAVARRLAVEGNTVAVIDKSEIALQRVGPLDVETRVGRGFDIETLKAAGIERADIVAATTGGDNTNMLVARIATEQFGVARVVARMKDAGRAEVCERLGIAAVSSVEWTANQVMSRLEGVATVPATPEPDGVGSDTRSARSAQT